VAVQTAKIWLENWLGFGQSLLDVGYIDSFAAGLSKQQQQQQSRHLHCCGNFQFLTAFMTHLVRVIQKV
jgi:hypothetical protein